MSLQNVGITGEEYATSYLKNNGFKIIIRNYRAKFGEIDIIAEKENKLFFCEVKTRIGTLHGRPYEAVNYRKIQHIQKGAQTYLLQNKIKNCKLSMQVISIILFPDLSMKEIKMYEVI